MSVLSTAGRTSERRNKDSSLSAPTTVSETSHLPNTFHFWNGDEYTGQFAVLKDKQKLTMNGRGTYKTADEQTYEGTWDNDYLKDNCKITFRDKSVFSGSLDEMVIQGLGRYNFKEKVEIEGEFVNNVLTGNARLKDPNQHMWKGKIDKNGSHVNFFPLHSFWQSILNVPSKNFQLFYEEDEEEHGNIWEEIY